MGKGKKISKRIYLGTIQAKETILKMTTQQKKRKLTLQLEKKWFNICMDKANGQCELCGKPAVQVHHFFPKGSYGYLRFNVENGVALCQKCHLSIHLRHAPLEVEIVKKRGQKWYDRLKGIADSAPPSYYTLGWLESIKKELDE